MKYNRGFIELFIAPLVLMVAPAIVLVSLNSAQGRAEEASVTATLRSVMPELIVCGTDLGVPSVPVVGKKICSIKGYTATWPTLRGDWIYTTPTGTLKQDTYTYGAMNGMSTIVCTIKDGRCVKR